MNSRQMTINEDWLVCARRPTWAYIWMQGETSPCRVFAPAGEFYQWWRRTPVQSCLWRRPPPVLLGLAWRVEQSVPGEMFFHLLAGQRFEFGQRPVWAHGRWIAPRGEERSGYFRVGFFVACRDADDRLWMKLRYGV